MTDLEEKSSIYLSQLKALTSQSLRELYGINALDVMELQKELFAQVQAFNNGKLPANVAENIATEASIKYLQLEYRIAQETNILVQYCNEKSDQYKPEEHSELENKLLQLSKPFEHEIEGLVSLIKNLEKYREMAEEFNKQIQNTVCDPDWIRQTLNSEAVEKMTDYSEEETEVKQNIQAITAKPLPLDEDLEKLATEENHVLRRWTDGRYKCKNLRDFINRYAENTGRNPTKDLILDYIVKEDGKAFTASTITTTLNTYGISPERKKTENRCRKGTHKNSL